ncbi:MAG: hypothetical protein Q9212_002011 [Teloschistes hypoglaucus]
MAPVIPEYEMSTLADITAKARNKNLRLNAPSVSKGNFMSPTMSSSKKFTSPVSTKESGAGQVIKDSPNKGLGFTDYTVDQQIRPRSPNASNNSFAKPDSLNRAPAQFVAGSRRPITRRLSSRGSLRNDLSPKFQPARPVPPIPKDKLRRSSIPVSTAYPAAGLSIPAPLNTGGPAVGSSIPAPLNTRGPAVGSSLPAPLNTRGPTAGLKSILNTRGPAGGEFIPLNISSNTKASEDSSIPATLNTEDPVISENLSIHPPSSSSSNTGSSEISLLELGPSFRSGNHEVDRSIQSNHSIKPDYSIQPANSTDEMFKKPLERIEESPQSAFRKTRIPAKSPEYAPILTVSSSAHRLIMGEGEENQPLTENMLRVTGEKTRKPRITTSQLLHRPTGPQSLRRPTSTQGLSRDRSSDKPGLRKFKSANFSSIRHSKPEHKTTQRPDELKKEEVFTIVKPKVSISPVKDSVTPVSDAVPVVSALLPESLREHVRKIENASYVAREDEVKARGDAKAPVTPPKKLDDEFPLRSSSHTKHPDYTASPASSLNEIEPKIDAGDFFPPLTDMASHRQIASQTILADTSKRNSTAHSSTRSQSSLSKGLKSGLRGLFHSKRSTDTLNPSTNKKRTTVTAAGSPTISMSDIHPLYRPTAASLNRTKPPVQHSSRNANTPETPAFASSRPTEMSTTTAMAMDLLDSARKERSSPKKKRLLSMAELVVDAITQARNAEKACEEARMAAREAAIASELCNRSVSEIAGLMRTWNVAE